VTPRHDFIDFLLTEHLLACFLLAGKKYTRKKCGSNNHQKFTPKDGCLKWLVRMVKSPKLVSSPKKIPFGYSYLHIMEDCKNISDHIM
jgi:hypothetical protein